MQSKAKHHIASEPAQCTIYWACTPARCHILNLLFIFVLFCARIAPRIFQKAWLWITHGMEAWHVFISFFRDHIMTILCKNATFLKAIYHSIWMSLVSIVFSVHCILSEAGRALHSLPTYLAFEQADLITTSEQAGMMLYFDCLSTRKFSLQHC